MYIENEEQLSQLALAFEDIVGVWPEVQRLPKVSSFWKERERPTGTCFEVKFLDNGFLRVYEYDGDIQICLEKEA